ncbi:MAG: DUF3365 domain-containing protein [Pseudomonadota bacterium]
MKLKVIVLGALLTLAIAIPLGVQSAADKAMFTPKQMADWLHLVMSTDRAVYTKVIVNRLTKKDKVIKASEHFEDDQALALPAQMFRFGAEGVARKTEDFSYSLMSLWPINKQNAPVTDVEQTGLKFIADNPGENYYSEEELGGKQYFTAIYPDPAVAPVCVSCHNEHKDSPRNDFKIGEVMGGVVIRIPTGG